MGVGQPTAEEVGGVKRETPEQKWYRDALRNAGELVPQLPGLLKQVQDKPQFAVDRYVLDELNNAILRLKKAINK